MAITKEKKSDIVAKLTDAFKEAASVAFVGFTKLTVADATRLREVLRTAGVRFFVAKKTLIKKALENHGYQGSVPELPGEVAVAWTREDVTAPSRGVYDFAKKSKLEEALKLLGGVFEGVFIDAQKTISIATIPPVPVLRGMFVNVINSPIQGLVIALNKLAEKRGA